MSARHDTPVDAVPRVDDAASALLRLKASASISSAYDAWREALVAHAEAMAQCAAELKQLDAQGALVVGAIQRLSGSSAAQPAAAGDGPALAAFQGDAAGKLARARAEVVARQAALQGALSATVDRIVGELRARVERLVATVKPLLRLAVRVLPGERRVLHAQRLGADEAIAFFFVVTGRLPTRYDALFDDSTDDPTLPPPWLYPEEGSVVRPTPRALASNLVARSVRWPVKGMVPWAVGEVAPMWRWLQRGPVMEAEVEDGSAFRSVLTAAEAETAVAHFIALKLAGRLELELTDL